VLVVKEPLALETEVVRAKCIEDVPVKGVTNMLVPAKCTSSHVREIAVRVKAS